ncbi:glutathione S-transferase family protein [Phenylobacterium sp.]|uniref:glutathione S-transferase family protein n=1 Tax=Phenylobacterium sp. TaxID=1871053 RepID=UPI0035B2FDFD
MSGLRLVSHHLCPYVQRAVIVAAEKDIPIKRTFIDLGAKPDWFLALSPTGKVPLLQAGGQALFESAPIVEYLDEISPGSLHPADPLERARHRAWAEFASATLADIGGLYSAPDAAAFEARRQTLAARFIQVEAVLGAGPWFDGARFQIVDAAWGPVFRYFDVIETRLDLGLFDALPRVRAWRGALAARPSVVGAVGSDYPQRLAEFFARRDSHLGRRFAPAEA